MFLLRTEVTKGGRFKMNVSLFSGFQASATEGASIIGSTVRTPLLILCGCALVILLIKIAIDSGK